MADGFIEFLMRKEQEKEARPQMMPEPVTYYDRETSRIPDRIRVSFADGSTVRITLSQNGNEAVVFEGSTSFPYLLNVQGQDGVSTGTAYVYMLDAAGNVISTTKYEGIAFYQQG